VTFLPLHQPFKADTLFSNPGRLEVVHADVVWLAAANRLYRFGSSGVPISLSAVAAHAIYWWRRGT